jgi:hypothetical protein
MDPSLFTIALRDRSEHQLARIRGASAVLRPGRRWFAVALLFSSACTSVLGMERAELEKDAGSGTGGSGGSPVLRRAACEKTSSECSQCLDNCEYGSLRDCIDDGVCRTNLSKLSQCLGPQCDADEVGTCAEKALAGNGFANCFGAPCGQVCAKTAVASTCAFYCTCMAQKCKQANQSAFGGSFETCLFTCGQLPGGESQCRWEHCELGTPLHCGHAIATPEDVCKGTPAERDTSICLAGKEQRFPCGKDSECCSRECLGAPEGVCK